MDRIFPPEPNSPPKLSPGPPSELPPEELPLDELPLDELPLDELPLDELPLDELPLDELPPEELLPDEPPLAALPPIEVAVLNANGNAPPAELVGPSVANTTTDPSAEMPNAFPIF